MACLFPVRLFSDSENCQSVDSRKKTEKPQKTRKTRNIKLKMYVSKPKIKTDNRYRYTRWQAGKLRGKYLRLAQSKCLQFIYNFIINAALCLPSHWMRCLPKTLPTPSSHNEAIIMFEIALPQRQRFALQPQLFWCPEESLPQACGVSRTQHSCGSQTWRRSWWRSRSRSRSRSWCLPARD